MIDVHYAPTMNGHKVAIMLEETGLDYRIIPYNLMEGDHLTAEFHALNPNHKIPVIIDHEAADHGGPLTVFETGAILQYLAEKTGKFMPADFRRREAARQWLTWQVSALGPMLGQASYFIRYYSEGQEHAIKRYSKEGRRLISVLESRLSEVQYLAEEYSIADIASWPYVVVCGVIGIDLEDYPALHRWVGAIGARPAVAKVMSDLTTAMPPSLRHAKMKLTKDQWSNVYGERMWTSPTASAAA